MLFELLWTDPSSLGESTSPFIDEGDGLTSERGRVYAMLSLVAHAVEYKMIVGAHNTVNVRCIWEVASSSSGMVDVSACHTVDAQRHVGVLPCSPGMVNADAHSTIGKMSAPTTLLGF